MVTINNIISFNQDDYATVDKSDDKPDQQEPNQPVTTYMYMLLLCVATIHSLCYAINFNNNFTLATLKK